MVLGNSKYRCLILNLYHREAGEMVKDGKTIKWDVANMAVTVPWLDLKGQIRKYKISPAHFDTIQKQLEPVHWGCVVDLTLEDKQVVKLDIVEDIMAGIFTADDIM